MRKSLSPRRPRRSSPPLWSFAGVCVGLILLGVATLSALAAAPTATPESPGSPTTSTADPVPTTPPSPPPPPVSYPMRGSGTYTVAPGGGRVLGHAGQLMRFQVAVENEVVNFDLVTAAEFVEETFADPRGWTGGGVWQLQRVGPGETADFTVYFVTPGTRDDVCGGPSDQYTNCRNGARVVVNMDRWMLGVPHIDDRETYRRYILNHETGHRLGHDHELCPGPGQPAPVMQQQTLGMHGCVLNPWPYLNGSAYRGQRGSYPDPIPL